MRRQPLLIRSTPTAGTRVLAPVAFGRLLACAALGIALFTFSAFGAAPLNGMARIGKVTMSDPTNGGLYSAAIDPVNGYAYFGGKHFMTKINIKGAQHYVVGTVAGNSQLVGVVDPAAGYCYFCAGSVVTRISLGAGDNPPAIVDTLTLTSNPFGGVIDTSDPNPANHYIYFLLTATPCVISKVSVATFKQVALLPLNSGENSFRRGVIDTQHGYLYFLGPAANTTTPSLIKIALGAGSSAPTRIGSVQLDALAFGMGAAVIDVAHGYAYCGTYTAATGNSSVPNVYKVSLGAGNAAPSLIGMATLYAGTGALNGPNAQEREICSGVLDPASGYAYFGSDHTYPAKIYQINLGSGNALPVESGMLQLNGGSHALGEPNGPNDGEQFLPRTQTEDTDYGEVFLQSSVIDPMRGDPTIPGSHYAYFGCDSYAGQITKILLPPPSSTFTWNGGNGAWAIGTGGWDLGNWTDVGNVVIGKGNDTAGIITVSSIINPASITFNTAQTGTYTLMVNGTIDMGTPVNVSAGAALRGTGGVVSRVIQPTATGVVWPGAAAVASAVPLNGESLSVAGLDMSGGGKLKIALNASGASSTQKLIVTGPTCTLGGTLSLGVPVGTNSANAYTVLSSPTGAINGTFSTVELNGVVVSGTTPVNVLYTPNAVTVTITGGVTPVKLDAFTARAEGAGVRVSWLAVSEFQNAGFNVYRRAANGRQPQVERSSAPFYGSGWTRVNPSLIAGRITSPDEKKYQFYDWASPGKYVYRLESVSLDGVGESYAKLSDPVSVDATLAEGLSDAALNAAESSLSLAASAARAQQAGALFDAAFLPAARVCSLEFAQQRANPRSLVPEAVSPRLRVPASPRHFASAARWFSSSNHSSGNFTADKVVYSKPGVMLIPQSMLSPGFDIHRLAILREGRGITALAVQPSGLLVYAPGYQDDYTDKDAFFLRATNSATAAGVVTHAQGLFASAQPVNASTPATATASFHDVYFDYGLRPYSYPPWFSNQYLADGTMQSFTVSTPNASNGAASLTLNLWSLTQLDGVSPDHALQVLVNGHPVGKTVWTGGSKMMQLSFQLDSGVLNAGVNSIDLVTPVLNGVAGQIAFLHSISVGYTRALDGSTPLDVYNLGALSAMYEVSNVPGASAWVVDARYSDRTALAPYETQAQANGGFKLRFNAAPGGSGHYLVVPLGQENLPLAVSVRHVKPAKTAAYMAAGPAQFAAAVQPLLMQRTKEGLRGAFVDQEQLFDFYNYGRYGPAGIQNAVRATQPRYLLLLGRTTYDYRNYSGLGVDPLCPAFLVSTTFWAQATSDSAFGDLGCGYPEIAVGRLPVNTPGKLVGAVQHVLANKGIASGFAVHAAADRADPDAGDFAAEADAIAQAQPEVAWQKNYLGITYQTSPEVSAALTAAANGGADLLMYIGHGNAVRLGKDDPRILDNNSVAAWTGSAVFLQSTCTANWMAKNETGYQSIAIQALTQPQGGISASIASSTYMNSKNATEFMSQLLANAGTSQRWGGALLKTQQWAFAKGGGFYADLSATEQIFGDPAMPISARLAP